MKLVQTSRLPMCCLLVILFFLFSCHPSPRKLTIVSGKTVYGNLALEDVPLQIHKWEESGWKYLGETRSGYHGSFRLDLPPGEYMITAVKSIRIGQGEVSVTGKLEGLKVEKAGGRIDQVVIRMNR